MPDVKWLKSDRKLPVRSDDQKEIDQLTKEFEQRGGIVQVIPIGMSADKLKELQDGHGASTTSL